MRWFRAALALALVIPTTALALSMEEIQAMVKDGKTPPADIVKAIQDSKDTWYPRHFYTLLDQGAPKEVVAAMATRAAVFYDPETSKSLEQIGAEIRKTVPAETIQIKSADDLVLMFEFYNDAKNELDAARATVPELGERVSGETEAAFDKRARAHAEQVAKAIAPAEGKVDNATMEMELPAVLDPFDPNEGCFPRASFDYDLTRIHFNTWRAGMGGAKTPLVVTVDPKQSPTVHLLRFVSSGTNRKFEGLSRPICPHPDDVKGVEAQGVKLKMTLRRTHKGEDWTAKAAFVGAKSNEPVKVKKP